MSAMLTASTGWARAVYIMSGGNKFSDQAVMEALIARGHTPTLGVEAWQWNGTQANLKDFEAVVLLNNYNWEAPGMQTAGQDALLKYVSQGGGLVTGEYLIYNTNWIWKAYALSILLPATSGDYSPSDGTTYVQAIADPIINNGLPRSFSFDKNMFDNYTESGLQANAGATVFYLTNNFGPPRGMDDILHGCGGLVGWNHSSGRVISFSTFLSDIELRNPNYARLFVNAVDWVANGPVLTLDSAVYRIGDHWTLKVSNGAPNSPVRIFGTSNDQVWEIPKWGTTDGAGNFKAEGTFAKGTAGSHTLRVEIGGKSSNDFSFIVSTVLALEAKSHCIGDAWTLRVSHAAPKSTVYLFGTSNGQSWEIPQWGTTDANGGFTQKGVFDIWAQGSHTLQVEVSGERSNTVSLVISTCK
jgi:hypothetical protein